MSGAINEMIKSFAHIKPFKGELTFKGDKSISHRALLLAAMAEGESVITNLSDAEDVKSTIDCLKSLGVDIINESGKWIIKGKGFKGFSKPSKHLYAGNSGTTARLLAGLLAAQNFKSVITGDPSLSQRPMDRVINPLMQIGANIKSVNGRLPLNISPVKELKAISYEMQVASAQVKSAIILAALHIDDETLIIEKVPTRNHTELMLQLPEEIKEKAVFIKVSRKQYPLAKNYHVPGDISSAAFFIILTLLVPGAQLTIRNILLNKSRSAFLNILIHMGADIQIFNNNLVSGEETGDLTVKGSSLKNLPIPVNIIPSIIDEIPALAIAGIFAEGSFELRHASELRVKESDRIRALIDNLHLTNLTVREFVDGFIIEGEPGGNMPVFDSFGDHRIGMAFTILSLLLESGGSVMDPDCINVSNPDFLDQIQLLEQTYCLNNPV